jgi:hypothetical protein
MHSNNLLLLQVIDESPAPNISYTMSCTCGSVITLGNGSSKKAAKKEAAGHMLHALKDMTKTLIPESADCWSTKKVYAKRKKTKSLVKMVSSFVLYSTICKKSLLIQWC